VTEERRGDWDGERRMPPCIIRRDQHGEVIRVPLCPLCAKQLLHTRAEHDQLGAAVKAGAR